MTAATVADVYAHAHPDAVVTLLMHKIMRAAEAQGLQEARLLLRDWLVILALSYHRWVSEGGNGRDVGQGRGAWGGGMNVHENGTRGLGMQNEGADSCARPNP